MAQLWEQGRQDISSFYSDKQDKCTGNEVDYHDYSKRFCIDIHRLWNSFLHHCRLNYDCYLFFFFKKNLFVNTDLKLGISEKSIFHEFHPDAEDLFNVTCDLKLVCEKLRDRSQRHKRQV